MNEVGIDERWHQYWHDNGEQLVWNDWLQKYSKYTDSCFANRNSSSAELTNKRETDSVTCQPCENTDSTRNEDEVSVSNKCDGIIVSFVDSQTSCLDDKECSQSVNYENHMEADKQLVDISGKAVSMSNADNDGADRLTADVLKQSHECNISDVHVTATEHTDDSVELSDGADAACSWRSLWEQHYDETYQFYYDWFMQWLQEEREMSQPCNYTSEPSGYTDDLSAQQTVTETSGLADDLLPPSYACNGYVAMSQESVTVVENLLSEMLLSVVEQRSVDYNCPADGNSHKRKKKKGKQCQHGLFEIFDCITSDTITILI